MHEREDASRASFRPARCALFGTTHPSRGVQSQSDLADTRNEIPAILCNHCFYHRCRHRPIQIWSVEYSFSIACSLRLALLRWLHPTCTQEKKKSMSDPVACVSGLGHVSISASTGQTASEMLAAFGSSGHLQQRASSDHSFSCLGWLVWRCRTARRRGRPAGRSINRAGDL